MILLDGQGVRAVWKIHENLDAELVEKADRFRGTWVLNHRYEPYKDRMPYFIKAEKDMNSIMVIKPYLWEGLWVFDDERTGLVKEALVAGVPEMLEGMCQANGIPLESAKQGFRLLFSATPFPEYQVHAKHGGEGFGDGQEGLGSDEQSGNWYEVVTMYDATRQPVPQATGMKGWLCPALFKYFDKAPLNLYVKAEEIKKS